MRFVVPASLSTLPGQHGCPRSSPTRRSASRLTAAFPSVTEGAAATFIPDRRGNEPAPRNNHLSCPVRRGVGVGADVCLTGNPDRSDFAPEAAIFLRSGIGVKRAGPVREDRHGLRIVASLLRRGHNDCLPSIVSTATSKRFQCLPRHRRPEPAGEPGQLLRLPSW